MTFLSYVAALTTRLRLGVSVLVLPRHNPIHLAKELAAIDQMSGGRLIVGVGLGAANDLPQYGISPERRVRRFMEHVEIMKALWTQTPVRYSGELYDLDNVNIEPKLAQQPHPPLWFGANADVAIRRAVRHADGWTGAGSAPARYVRRASGDGEGAAWSRRDATRRHSRSRSGCIWRWTMTSSGRLRG